jgi:hypothetical protein
VVIGERMWLAKTMSYPTLLALPKKLSAGGGPFWQDAQLFCSSID